MDYSRPAHPLDARRAPHSFACLYFFRIATAAAPATPSPPLSASQVLSVKEVRSFRDEEATGNSRARVSGWLEKPSIVSGVGAPEAINCDLALLLVPERGMHISPIYPMPEICNVIGCFELYFYAKPGGIGIFGGGGL